MKPDSNKTRVTSPFRASSNSWAMPWPTATCSSLEQAPPAWRLRALVESDVADELPGVADELLALIEQAFGALRRAHG